MGKIVLSGYYGFGNFGDEAILSAITRGLNSNVDDLFISVLSNSPDTYLSENFNIKCVPRMSPFLIIKEILSCNLVISGGGGLIQDSSGISTIIYYLGIVKLAKMLGKKVMFYAQGLGPVTTGKGKKLVKQIADKVDLITVRDEDSKNLFRELGVVKPPIIVTADPVLSLEGTDNSKIFDSEKLSGSSPFNFAISVRSWNSSFDFLPVIADCADRVIKKFNARVVLIPFQKSQDLKICEKLSEIMETKPHIIRGDYAPEEMIGFIGKMDFLLAMRLHALIFAASSLVPMAGIVYDPKVEAFSKSINIPFWNLEELNSDDIFNEVKRIVSEKDEVKKALFENIKPLYEKSLLTPKIVKDLLQGLKPEDIFKKYSDK